MTRAIRVLSLVGATLLGVAAAPACGGQSIEHTGGDDDSSGGGGTNQGGASGTGVSGDAGKGGTVGSGGTVSSGGTAGTIAVGGSSVGGGTGVGGGTAGASGTSTVPMQCAQPLVPGPCRGYEQVYGFSVVDGNCQPFIYGGCEGNSNRFDTLAACEATCGGSLSRCPERSPGGVYCPREGEVCSYDYDGCLCAPKTQDYSCSRLDPTCTSPSVDGGLEIRLPPYQRCQCSSGVWTCS